MDFKGFQGCFGKFQKRFSGFQWVSGTFEVIPEQCKGFLGLCRDVLEDLRDVLREFQGFSRVLGGVPGDFRNFRGKLVYEEYQGMF